MCRIRVVVLLTVKRGERVFFGARMQAVTHNLQEEESLRGLLN